MTTQNVHQHTTRRNNATFLNLPTATYYYPVAPGAAPVATPNDGLSAVLANGWIDMDGYDHLSIMFRLTAGAADSVELTIWSDDGVTATFEWPETLSGYDSITNSYNATYTAANSTLRGHLHYDDCNGKRFQVRLVVVGGGPANSGVITLRRTKK